MEVVWLVWHPHNSVPASEQSWLNLFLLFVEQLVLEIKRRRRRLMVSYQGRGNSTDAASFLLWVQCSRSGSQVLWELRTDGGRIYVRYNSHPCCVLCVIKRRVQHLQTASVALYPGQRLSSAWWLASALMRNYKISLSPFCFVPASIGCRLRTLKCLNKQKMPIPYLSY